MKPLKKTDLGVAQAFFLTPKRDENNIHMKYIFLCATLNETFMAKHDSVLPRIS